jgi:hypothetical protein
MRKTESFRRYENDIIMKTINVNKVHMMAYLSMMVLLSTWTYTISCTPQRSFVSASAVAASSHSFIKSNRRTQTIIKSIQIFRGGSHVIEDSDEEEEKEEEEDTEEEVVEEDHSLPSREESTMDNDEEANDDVVSSPSSSSSVRNTTPIKVMVKTGLNTPLLDQTWESTCSRTRTIASLKQSLARQMRGRPPVHTQRLLHNGVLLTDDAVLLDALVQEQEEEEEEEQTVNDDNVDDEENMVTLQLILDTPPPTDTKFATDYADMLSKMTKKELLDAYAINMAASNYIAQNYLLASSVSTTGEEEDPKIITTTAATSDAKESVTVTVRKNALLLKEQLLSSFSEEHRRSIEEDTRTEEEQNLLEEEEMRRRRRKGISSTSGGATTNVKVLVQRNLNVDWPDTIRNTLLLLFFGCFGASSPLSQMFLLTAAPLCILLQVRPVKVILKQLFYAIGTPPAIILSLLPAPQQAIMSLNYDLVLQELYGVAPTKPTSTTSGSNTSTELQTEEDDEQQQISMGDDEEELDEDENSIESEEESDEEALKEEEDVEEEEEEMEDGDEYEG